MKPTLPPAERYLARHVWYKGRDHGLATVAVNPDGTVTITPFTRETPGTIFIDGTIHVTTGPDGHPLLTTSLPT